MEEIERKIFAQFDDQERGLRTSAFEKLYAHFTMQTPPRLFRDILQELEKGEEAAKKCTALENNVTVLKQASVADHQNFNQRYIAALACSLGSRINITLSYCSVSACERVRSSFQAKASSRSSPARSGRCRFLLLAGALAKRAL